MDRITVTTDATTNHILGLKNTRAMSVAKTKNQKRKPFLKVSSLFGCKISPYFSGIIPPRFKFMLKYQGLNMLSKGVIYILIL